ncbi:hypothetical protein F0562_018204 [Nyssa sinensis]|uniref:DUF4283 domain-containing protein n=1 Tax=Nyssa sinensis TaxID=561372 RepID=A0A5J4ZAQ9_9ASTE|nr:hypothetical protein F0562_018204 [Nyssa sinensis]
MNLGQPIDLRKESGNEIFKKDIVVPTPSTTIDGRSFADIVKGLEEKENHPTIMVNEEDNGWLYRSLIAKLPSLRSIESTQEAFICDGIINIQIGKIWGEVMHLDDATMKSLSFECGRILIKTMDLINKVVKLSYKGKMYQIRVIEEQIVRVNNIKNSWVCNHLCASKEENIDSEEGLEDDCGREEDDDMDKDGINIDDVECEDWSGNKITNNISKWGS